MFCKLAFMSVLFGFCVSAYALEPLFSNDRVVYSSEYKDHEYRIVLGELKKINAVLVAENEQKLIGQVTRKTIEIHSFISVDEAWNHVKKQIGQNFEQAYYCKGFNCGSSNAWAIERFKVRQLYGLDQSQYYAVWQRAINGGVQYVVVYLVQRGNKRIYAQVDTVFSVSSVDDSVKKKQKETLPGSETYWQISDFSIHAGTVSGSLNAIGVITQKLKNNTRLHLNIVGHDFSNTTLEKQRRQGEEYAAAFKRYIVAKGIEAARINVYSVGSLAPEGKNNQPTVVLILKDLDDAKSTQ